MPTGDYDWAVHEIAADVGDRFYSDNLGLNILHMALYEGSNTDYRLSPDIQRMAYNSFFGYDEGGRHFPGYMEQEYEYDAEDNFDWDTYRDWYE